MIQYFKLKYFIVTFMILTSSSYALGEDDEFTVDFNDVMRCDSVFRPPGCIDVGTEDAAANLENGLGIILPQHTARMPRLPPITIRSYGVTTPSATVGVTLGARPSGTVDSPTDPTNQTPEEYNSGIAEFGNNNNNNTQTASIPPNIQVQNPNTRVVGGQVYADDDNGEPSIEPGEIAKVNSAPRTIAAIDLNKKNAASASSSDSDDSAGKLPNGGGSGAGNLAGANQQTFEVGEKPGVLAGLLGADFAKALEQLSGLMNVGGDRGHSTGRRGTGKGHASKNGRNVASVNAAKFKMDRNLLKDQYGHYKDKYGRYIANQPQFGSAKTHLFGSMCKHYADYARTNRIPYDRSGCPKQ